MKDLLTIYRDRLTDLTARNKSVRLMRLTNKNHFDVYSFSQVKEKLGERILDEICNLKNQVALFPLNNFEEEAIILNRKLTQLKREIDLIEQETGVNTFYVAYGFLEGFLVEDMFIRSPLLFYPARLIKTNVKNIPYWAIEVGEESIPFINRTLIMALQKYLGTNIAAQLEEELEYLPKNKEEIISFLFDTLRKYNISLTTASATDYLLSFKTMKKEDIPTGQKGFAIYPYSVMGKFQQSTSTLLGDYKYLLENPLEDGFLHDLLNGKETTDDFKEIDVNELNMVDEADTYFVLDTDTSQEAVVISSRDQKGLIVHGPPGTGKSQVIVNLVVDRLAKGEKVLLVCQKPTALNVVYNRLGSINLQSHAALVHDYNNNKGDVYAKISAVIQKQMSNFYQDHLRVSNEINVLSNKLNKVASSLHRERPCGKNLFFLYNIAKWDPDLIIEVNDLLDEVTYDSLQCNLVDLRIVLELVQKYDHSNYPWAIRKSFASFTVKDQFNLKNILEQLVKDVEKGLEIRDKQGLLFEPIYYLENRQTLIKLNEVTNILKLKNIHKNILKFYEDENREFELEDHLLTVKQAYGSIRQNIDALSKRLDPVSQLTAEEAEIWNQKISDFIEINNKITRFFTATWYSLKKELQEHCEKHDISFDGNSIRNYKEEIESYLLFEKLRKETHKNNFYMDSPIINDINIWEEWINKKNKALQFLDSFVQAKVIFPDWLSNPDKIEKLEKYASDNFINELEDVIELTNVTERILSLLDDIQTFIKDEEVNEIIKDIKVGIFNPNFFQGLFETLDSFTSLCRLDQLKDDMGDFQRTLVNRCILKAPLDETKNVVDHWSKIIENSFLHAWILKAEDEEPHVKDVSTEIYQLNLARYQKLLKEKRDTIPKLISNRLWKQSNEVQGKTKQKLKSESTKKRKQASLRQVLGTFTDDLLNLIPCWLCTPEAVSAIFPFQQNLFDLVIFDEASQCPVENAIPSIYRAKRLVIAGDEKQLPPSSFFQVSMDDEDDEEEDNSVYIDKTDTFAKSLLDWSKPRFIDQWLTWHYRSSYEELINFSNYAFYGKRMQIAPSNSLNKISKPIEFIQVDGQWINRSNRIEAEKIVDVVLDILKYDSSKPTLGVITFNKQQADLINDVIDERAKESPEIQYLLEEVRTRKKGDENVGLFIKNIENVQGDERDIILFSVAYAKDSDGKMVNQFGPLSREGGENRLNVAITRAKKKVYIVCSFEPSTWTRVETLAKGVRLFKRYLEYGKAISDGEVELAKSILNGLIDSTTIQNVDKKVIFDSGFEQEVYEALTRMGYNVDTQIGISGYLIDMGIIAPHTKDSYLLGIECDGAMYHSSKVARERDIYRQRFLESKGWNIHRIWSRNWWNAKDKELKKIEEIVSQLDQRLDIVNYSNSK